MRIPLIKSDYGKQSPASLIAALGLVALVPAVGVLWFMSVAMRNERLAVQERLTAVYANHLASLQSRATAFVRERQAALQAHAGGAPAATFAAIARAKLADAVIVTDTAGRALYPSGSTASVEMRAEEGAEWVRARELEFQRNDFASAAETYGRIAASGGDANTRARAMQAQAVCWLKTGEKERALVRLEKLAGDSSLRGAASEQGALIVPDAQLLILKTLGSSGGAVLSPTPKAAGTRAEAPRYAQTFDDLVARLNDYADANLPANQRRFLMTEVQALTPTPNLFPTLAAENLAADYLDTESPTGRLARPQSEGGASSPPPTSHGADGAAPSEMQFETTTRFQRTPLAKVWRLASADGTIVALFREERLRAELAKQLDAPALPDVRVALLAPGESAAPAMKMPVPPRDASELLPGWRLALGFRDGDPLAEASARQARFYLWMGVGVVAIIGVLAVMVARYVAAQVRFARLKNELVSTVSHELKTPLASMRMLLDTMSAGRFRDEAQMRRYLHLTTKENQRLSHLIDNFLVFSRLERGQQRFAFTELSPPELVRTAVDALGEKLTAPPCLFSTQVAPDLPAIRGDADALSTVLINLLDNACKYTNGEKRIGLTVGTEGDEVVFTVTDNGIGIPPEEQRRIFDRFYQVDQSLTRQKGGCGLGLSIVQSIVRAHGGTVEVESEPGRGSVFRMRLPMVNQTA